jgi:hypothetical protein
VPAAVLRRMWTRTSVTSARVASNVPLFTNHAGRVRGQR